MKAVFIMMLSVVFLSYSGLGLFLYVFQRSFVYFPTPEVQQPIGKNQRFAIANERINTLVLNEGKERAILYFGGNGEAVAYNAEAFSAIFPHHTVYLINYRGYGRSTGTPSEAAIYADMLTIYDRLKPMYSRISLIGRSLGSGVATFVASQKTVDKLVLITPFDSIQHIAQKTYPIFPMSLMLKDKYDSIGRAAAIKANTLMLIAEHDRLVTRAHSDALFNALPKSQTHQIVIKEAGHNTISNKAAYYKHLGDFINAF